MSCPRCGSPRTVARHLHGGNINLHFQPSSGFHWPSFFSRLLYLERTAATVCASCGLLWMEFPTSALASRIRQWGTPEARAWLEQELPTPLKG
jgi:hypothetical protein